MDEIIQIEIPENGDWLPEIINFAGNEIKRLKLGEDFVGFEVYLTRGNGGKKIAFLKIFYTIKIIAV